MKQIPIRIISCIIISTFLVPIAALADCATNASILSAQIKVRDSGVLLALNESIPAQIKNAGSAARFIATVEALKVETASQREAAGQSAKASFGGAGGALDWPNGCSWPASGTYCSSLGTYQLLTDALRIYDFYIETAQCYQRAGM